MYRQRHTIIFLSLSHSLSLIAATTPRSAPVSVHSPHGAAPPFPWLFPNDSFTFHHPSLKRTNENARADQSIP